MGVGWNDPDTNQNWAEEEGFQFEVWTDDDQALSLYYDAAESGDWFPSRVTKLLDSNGTLILEYVDSVNVGTHPGQVLQDCEAIFGQ